MSTTLRLSELPDEISLGELFNRLGTLENAQLDFKREAARLKDLIPAMAMTDGGVIVIGINDQRMLHGWDLTQKHQDMITKVSRDVDVEVQFKSIAVDGVEVVLIAVPEVRRRIVTTTDGRLLRRVGSDNTPLVGDRLSRFVREREEKPAEEDGVGMVDSSLFDLELINEALALDNRPAVVAADYLKALVDLDLATPQAAPADPLVLKAAILMFAVDPRRFVTGASVQLIRRTGVGPGPGPTRERVEISGPIPHLLDKCAEFVASHTSRFQAVVGTRRIVLSEYPEEVLREALLNALAHRDYGLQGSTVDVSIWDDRIEVRSPGGLPGPITLENIRDEHYSRNRRIMRSLKSLGLVEEFGEGVDRMFEQMDARLMDPPVIGAGPSSVVVTLRNRFLVSVEEQAWLGLLTHLQLSNNERRVLALTYREGTLTRRRLRDLMPNADADRLLRTAVVKGLLVRTGQRGGAGYELSDEVVMRAGSSGVEAQSRKRQLLLDEIRKRGSLSTAEGATLLDEPPTLVRHLLNDLAASGAVEAKGRTRARRYHAG